MTHTAVAEAIAPITVELAWSDELGAQIQLACRFTLNGLRHAVEKHVGKASEHWGRLVRAGVANRLSAAAQQGPAWVPTVQDFHDFVDDIHTAMQRSSSRPLLCTFLEQTTAFRSGSKWRPQRGNPAIGKILFVLQSGGVVFVQLDGEPRAEPSQLSGRFLTCYFPCASGWSSGRRAYAETVNHFVMKWARHIHLCGQRKLPDPEMRHPAADGNRKLERRRFQFVTPETWGFRAEPDGMMVFRQVPRWQ